MQGAWGRAIPGWGKVAVARRKCGLEKVAYMDRTKFRHAQVKPQRLRLSGRIPHEIARKISDEIPHEIARRSKYETIRPFDRNSSTRDARRISHGRYTTFRLRSCISPFSTFSESTIKAVLNQSDKKTECFSQKCQKKPGSAKKCPMPRGV